MPDCGTGAFCKKRKLSSKRLWTLYLCKTLCNRTFICRNLQEHNPASIRFHIKPYPKKILKAACATLLLFFPLEISFFNIEVCFFFFFQAYLIGRIILSQVTLRYSVLFNSCRSSIVDFKKEKKKRWINASFALFVCLKRNLMWTHKNARRLWGRKWSELGKNKQYD